MSNYNHLHDDYRYTTIFMTWWIILMLVVSLGGIALLHVDSDIIINAIKWIAQL